MLVTWRYQKRESIIHSFDPRAWIIFNVIYFSAVLMFWDFRFQIGFLVLAMIAVLLSGVRWFDSWRSWLDLGGFILFFTLFTFFTGRGGLETFSTEHSILTFKTQFSILNWTPALIISAEKIMHSLCMFIRIINLSMMTALLVICISPDQYGVIFRRLGLPDPIAYGMDLTLRFIPSFGKDFSLTLDAQRARGLEIGNHSIGFISKIRKLIPLIVPVTIHAISSSEDITNSMDLRAFGSGPRTWLVRLQYRGRDYALLTLGLIILTVSISLFLMGYGSLWVPDLLMNLAK